MPLVFIHSRSQDDQMPELRTRDRAKRPHNTTHQGGPRTYPRAPANTTGLSFAIHSEEAASMNQLYLLILQMTLWTLNSYSFQLFPTPEELYQRNEERQFHHTAPENLHWALCRHFCRLAAQNMAPLGSGAGQCTVPVTPRSSPAALH